MLFSTIESFGDCNVSIPISYRYWWKYDDQNEPTNFIFDIAIDQPEIKHPINLAEIILTYDNENNVCMIIF